MESEKRASLAPPAVPPKPFQSASYSSVGNGNGDTTPRAITPQPEPQRVEAEPEEEEEEETALNPNEPQNQPPAPTETEPYSQDSSDPYAALANLSSAGFGGNGILGTENGYDFQSQFSVSGTNRNELDLDSSLF